MVVWVLNPYSRLRPANCYRNKRRARPRNWPARRADKGTFQFPNLSNRSSRSRRCVNVAGSAGFTKWKSIPDSYERLRCSSRSYPVTAMTCGRRMNGICRNRRTTSQPSISPGKPRSRRTTSGGRSSAATNAEHPSEVTRTSWPAMPNSTAMLRAVSGSSSTMRTRMGAPFCMWLPSCDIVGDATCSVECSGYEVVPPARNRPGRELHARHQK
jgi:hypothetical protein